MASLRTDSSPKRHPRPARAPAVRRRHHARRAQHLYSTRADTIDSDVEHAAELFAVHAALALGKARRESQLIEAVNTRKVIGQAIGLVMERYQLDEARAFQFPVRASTTSNITLRDIAAELVQTAEEQYSPSLREA